MAYQQKLMVVVEHELGHIRSSTNTCHFFLVANVEITKRSGDAQEAAYAVQQHHTVTFPHTPTCQHTARTIHAQLWHRHVRSASPPWGCLASGLRSQQPRCLDVTVLSSREAKSAHMQARNEPRASTHPLASLQHGRQQDDPLAERRQLQSSPIASLLLLSEQASALP